MGKCVHIAMRRLQPQSLRRCLARMKPRLWSRRSARLRLRPKELSLLASERIGRVRFMAGGRLRRSARSLAASEPVRKLHTDAPLPEIPGHFPDVCIAYKLHLECGKLINLYDWLQCWLSIIANSEDVNEVKDGVIDPRLHARFSRAVSELQFLGFIKPSKRKTDHVERLTF